MAIWNDKVTIVKGLVALPLACLLASLFYHLGIKSQRKVANRTHTYTSDVATTVLDGSKPLLRSESSRSHPSPLISSIEAELPQCAQDVYLTLHKEIGGEQERTCRGLMISDDVIVTSKACSEFKFTFELAGWGIVSAVPHSSLNSKLELIGSRLGLLKFRTPMFTHYEEMPVRRTRMFLSYAGADAGKALFVTCGDKKEPIAHNFPVDEEMVPLHELSGVVPEDILWEEVDISTAVKFRHNSQDWWSKLRTLKDVDSTVERWMELYRGPPGSASLLDAGDDFAGSAGILFEAVDQRGHRRMECFTRYFDKYRNEKPFSGMHFFDWLEYGNGRQLLELNKKYKFFKPKPIDKQCVKERFNSKTVHYFNEEERKLHEIYITPSDNGQKLIARYKINNELVPETGDEDEPFTYVWSLDKTLYLVDNRWNKEKYGRIKHSAILHMQPTLSAGDAHFGENGSIWGVDFNSGHYWPGIQATSMMYQYFKDNGFNVTAINWIGRNNWSSEKCDETDWESIDVGGFVPSELARSCYELLKGPTFMFMEDVE